MLGDVAMSVSAERLGDTELIETKCAIPVVLSPIIHRDRPTRMLQAGSKRRVTSVLAPPGAGKTTLVCEWAASLSPRWPVCWLTLDDADNDPRHLFRYLGRALRPAVGGSASDLLTNLGSKWSLERAVAAVVSAATALHRRFTLILDNMEVLTAPDAIHGIELLLRYQPASMHVVLISSRDSFELAGLVGGSDLVQVGVGDLSFDETACRLYAENVLGIDLAPDTAQRLALAIDGWVGGLALVSPALADSYDKDCEEAVLATVGGMNRRIFAYLSSQVLDKLDDDERYFLERISVLDELTPAACEAVLDDPGAGAMLARVARVCLFLTPVGELASTYVIHPCLAEVLRGSLAARLSEVEVARLHRRAASWYSQSGDVVRAIRSSLNTNDDETTVGLIDEHLGFLGSHHDEIMATCTRRIRPAALLTCPKVATEVVAAHIGSGAFFEAENLLGLLRAEPRGLEADLEVAMLGAVLGCVVGDPVTGAQRAQHLLATEKRGRFRSTLEYYVMLGRRPNGGTAGWELPCSDLPAGVRTTLAEEGYGAEPDSMRLYWRAVLAENEEARGNLFAAAQYYEEALTLAKVEGLERNPGYTVLTLGLSAVHRQWGHLRLAAQLAAVARDDCLGGRSDRLCWLHSTRVVLLLARVAAAQGQIDEARKLLSLAAGRAHRRKRVIGFLDEVDEAQVIIDVLDGDQDALRLWGRRRLMCHTGEEQHLLGRLLTAQAMLLVGRFDEAADSLTDFLDAFTPSGIAGERILRARCLRAVAYWELGRPGAAADDVLVALAAAEPQEYLQFWREVHPSLHDILSYSQRQMGNEPRGLRPEGAAPSRDYVRSALAATEGLLDEELAEALATGEAVTNGDVVDLSLEPLTPREKQVLALLVAGMSPRRISQSLHISANTVKTHVHRIYEKFGAHSRQELLDIVQSKPVVHARRARRLTAVS